MDLRNAKNMTDWKKLNCASDFMEAVANRKSTAVKKHILVLGGGFAGFGSAIGAFAEFERSIIKKRVHA
jgi:heterodisulfide reductase subunit A-like polyferredoxin